MNNPGIYHLFVYGSLRSGFRSAAYEYISRYFDFIADGKVKGNLFDMGSYPAAVPSEGDEFITGELYRAKEEGEFPWAIAQLDDYEGVNVEGDEAQLYRREVAEIQTGTETVMAWMYWYSGDVSGKPHIASGDVIEYLKSK
jgi:gamma-glutamylcyclotransferase (GGCT)/AIG2-like uncharacterized protein YtfP